MPNPEGRRRLRASDADRDAVLDALQRAHVEGRLSVEELVERQEVTLRTRYVDELPDLLDDLPDGDAWLPAPRGSTAPVPASAPAPAAWTATVLSGRVIELQPGMRLRNLAWWGGDEIYVRDAMGPGVVLVLELHAVMAGHDIFVPPGVRVVDEQIAVMAGNDINEDARGDGSNGTLVLRGVLFWAGHEVKLDQRPRAAGGRIRP